MADFVQFWKFFGHKIPILREINLQQAEDV